MAVSMGLIYSESDTMSLCGFSIIVLASGDVGISPMKKEVAVWVNNTSPHKHCSSEAVGLYTSGDIEYLQ